jgi:hypothetical protein
MSEYVYNYLEEPPEEWRLEQQETIGKLEEQLRRTRAKSGRRKKALRQMNRDYMLIDRWYQDAAARARAFAEGKEDDLTYELQAQVRTLEARVKRLTRELKEKDGEG